MGRRESNDVVGPAAAWRLIGNRDFGPYFFGNALSSSGTWFQNLAGALLVYRLTHSAFLLGVLNVAQFAPVLLLAPWTGLAADRFDRRRLLIATQLLALVRARPQERPPRGEARLLASLRFVRERPRLLALLLVVTAVGFASDPVNTEAPAFAHAFGEVDTKAGFIIGAFGAGAVTAALTVAGRVAGSRARMATTLTLLGSGVVALSVTPWLSLGYVFLFVAGFGYLASNTSATTRLQLGVAESQRGRIMALWSVAFLGLRPLASLIDGTIAGAFGVRAAGICLAVPALVAAAVIVRLGDRPMPGREAPPAE